MPSLIIIPQTPGKSLGGCCKERRHLSSCTSKEISEAEGHWKSLLSGSGKKCVPRLANGLISLSDFSSRAKSELFSEHRDFVECDIFAIHLT